MDLLSCLLPDSTSLHPVSWHIDPDQATAALSLISQQPAPECPLWGTVTIPSTSSHIGLVWVNSPFSTGLERRSACCTEEEEAKEPPFPAVDQATRTEFGRSSIRLRAAAAMATSVARASSLWKRSPSPMTCFQRANWPSTQALSL